MTTETGRTMSNHSITIGPCGVHSPMKTVSPQIVAQFAEQRRSNTHDVEAVHGDPADQPRRAAEIIAAVDGALLDKSFANEADKVTVRLGRQ